MLCVTEEENESDPVVSSMLKGHLQGSAIINKTRPHRITPASVREQETSHFPQSIGCELERDTQISLPRVRWFKSSGVSDRVETENPGFEPIESSDRQDNNAERI